MEDGAGLLAEAGSIRDRMMSGSSVSIVQAFLLCDSVVVDARSGKTVIQGIFDRIMSKAFPAVHPNCALYARINLRQGNSCEFEIAVQSPSGSIERPMAPQRVVGAEGDYAQMIIQVQGLPVQEPGRYVLSLILNGQIAAEFPFTAISVAEPKPEAQGGLHGHLH
jgi:hypothetical protein